MMEGTRMLKIGEIFVPMTTTTTNKPNVQRIFERTDAIRREEQKSLFQQKGVPILPQNIAPLSNTLAKSALFQPTRKRGPRKYLKGEVIASQPDIKLVYSGEELDIADMDNLLELYRRAAGRKPVPENLDPSRITEHQIRLDRADFLRALGKSKSGRNYDLLVTSLERLQGAVIKVEFEKEGKLLYSYGYHCIGSLEINNTGKGESYYTIPLYTYHFFEANTFAYINMKRRKLLSHNPNLCKWLQSYAGGVGKEVYKIKISTLMRYANATGRERDFRKALFTALNDLVKVGEFKYWQDHENCVIEWLRNPKGEEV